MLSKNIGRILILFILNFALGLWLYKYFQPLCERCLPHSYCPPCISKEQYVTIYLFGVIELLILIRMIYLALNRKIFSAQRIQGRQGQKDEHFRL
jgi:hypothetical protein